MTTYIQLLSDQILDLLRTDYDAPDTTTVDTDYESLGFDSLVLVEVAVDLTRRFGVEVADDELQQAGNIAATIELLRSKGVSG
ncbi:acyl carrier protein [Streptomyces sp. NPDC051561]|uniref:acyl carrier protein n=1 Tax=Streptomyces sp. NPDC051561 TaxID=3365658 RepID=UPI00379F543B